PKDNSRPADRIRQSHEKRRSGAAPTRQPRVIAQDASRATFPHSRRIKRRLAPHSPPRIVAAFERNLPTRRPRPLLNAGFAVRAIARRPEYLVARVPSGVEVVRGDAFDRASLVAALKHCEFAYYLVHSMSSSGSFEEQDREAATSFASAA